VVYLIDGIPSLPINSPSLGITIGVPVLVGNLGVETTGTQGDSSLTGGLTTSGSISLFPIKR
jgi:hypothetical protein